MHVLSRRCLWRRLSIPGAFLAMAAALLAVASDATALLPTPVVVSASCSASEVAVGDDFKVSVNIVIDDGWHINGHEPAQDFLVATTLSFELPDGIEVSAVEYPQPHTRRLAVGGDRDLRLYENSVVIEGELHYVANAASGVKPAAILYYQACNDTVCLRPASLTVPLSLEIVPGDSVTTAGLGDDGADMIAALVNRGVWAMVAGMILLGLALNLTPCVYPLIGVTLAYFGGQAGGNRNRRLVLASVYTLGIAATFSVLGAVAALSGGLFGGALAHPVVNVALAALMFTLAASSFGFYQMRLPAGLGAALGRSGNGLIGALFMGMTMGLVAAPCVGPVVIGLLIFVGSRGDIVLGLSLFFLLAVGLGLPYVALAMAAGSIASLPRSGGWLQWTEHFFGCVLIAMGIYFLRPVLPDLADRVMMPTFIGLSVVYLAFFDSSGVEFRGFVAGRRLVGVLALAVLVLVYIPRGETGEALQWEAFSAETYDSARLSGQPFVIEFGAEWCMPCREMKERTFNDPQVIEAAEGIRLLSVDMTTTTDLVERTLSSFRVFGAPTTLFFGANGKEWKRRSGFIAPQEFAQLLRQVRRAVAAATVEKGV